MHDIDLEKSRDKIKAAYKASSFTEGIFPEPEAALKQFETQNRLKEELL